MPKKDAASAAQHVGPGWRSFAVWDEAGYYRLESEALNGVPVRLFLTPELLAEAEDSLYPQIVSAANFPETRLVVVTPDVHTGYGVPVGCVILTDAEAGAVAMGPVGYDIGCGMVSARSNVPAEAATQHRRQAFNQAVMRRVAMGIGSGHSAHRMGTVTQQRLEELVRGGAEYYVATFGATFDRSRAERDRLPVDDAWVIPWGGRGKPERGVAQLGSLGGGNHFMELQRCEETGTLFVQVHTGSRGFGHGLATNYFDVARAELGTRLKSMDLGYFVPDSPHYREYLNAVAAGGNYAILNRLLIFEQLAEAFAEVFDAELELIYEISHNLVQREQHPAFGDVWVHRKGATRAFPGGHPALVGTPWEQRGHPVLIPGSNKDYSYILRPLPGAVKSGYSVNHGAGRRLSRGQALQRFSQRETDAEYRTAGIVVNDDGHVPLDESGPAYKSAAQVVAAVTAAGLAEVEYTLWPLASLKGTDERRDRTRDRHREQSGDAGWKDAGSKAGHVQHGKSGKQQHGRGRR
jgi:tRNA-splicing ligase RtcB